VVSNILALIFFLICLVFVYRSFYGMRIEKEHAPEAARAAAD
jgi:preprotein translocase subunit SecG